MLSGTVGQTTAMHNIKRSQLVGAQKMWTAQRRGALSFPTSASASASASVGTLLLIVEAAAKSRVPSQGSLRSCASSFRSRARAHCLDASLFRTTRRHFADPRCCSRSRIRCVHRSGSPLSFLAFFSLAFFRLVPCFCAEGGRRVTNERWSRTAGSHGARGVPLVRND